MLSHYLCRKLKIGHKDTLEKGNIRLFSSQLFLTQAAVEEKNASVRLVKAFKHISQVQRATCGLCQTCTNKMDSSRVIGHFPPKKINQAGLQAHTQQRTLEYRQTPSQSLIKAHLSEGKGKETKIDSGRRAGQASGYALSDSMHEEIVTLV